MKRKTIKAKLAMVLSAGMAFAMLAPAMPAHAANSKLIFDFKSRNAAVSGIVDNIEFEGSTSEKIIDKVHATYPTWQTKSGGTIGLPYWSNGFNANVNKPKNWESDMDLKGYKISDWRDTALNGRNNRDRVDSIYFQEHNIIYQALLTDNGSNIASYWITRKGKDDIYVPGIADDNAIAFKAGKFITAKADLPLGYKLLNQSEAVNGNNGRTVEVFDSMTPSPTDPSTLPTGAHYDKENNVAMKFDPDRKFVSGNAHNRDMVINFVYGVDENKNFNLNVWDVFLDKDGKEVSRKKRTTVTNNVLGELPTGTNAIGFDTTKIKSNNSNPPRYMIATTVTPYGGTPTAADGAIKYIYNNINPTFTSLADAHPVTVVFTKAKNTGAGVAEGDFSDKGLVDANINPTNSTSPTDGDKTFNISSELDLTNYNDAGGQLRGRNSNYNVNGKMINQSVSIYYAYLPNPEYYTNVSVEYVDENSTNITDKVIAATKETGYTGATIEDSYDSTTHIPTKFYKDGNSIVLKVDAALGNTNAELPIPKLTGYKFGTTDISVDPTDSQLWRDNYLSGNLPSVTFVSADYAKSEIGQTSTAGESAVIKVMYKRDLGQLVAIKPTTDMGGTIKVMDGGSQREYDTAQHPTDEKYVERKASATAGAVDVEIKEDDLPIPVADPGYIFKNWVYEDGSAAGQEFTNTDLPKTFTIAGASGASNVQMDIKAVFEKDGSKYNKYKIISGDNYTSINVNDLEVLNLTAVHFSNLATYTDVGSNVALNVHPFGTNYNIVWYDSSNNVMLKIDSTGALVPVTAPDTNPNIRPIADGEIFRVYVESNVTPTAYDPQVITGASGQPEYLNTITGEPQIVIDQMNPSPIIGALDYIVTDGAGNVVKIISGTSLISSGGVIKNTTTSNFLTPGNNYRVYTALRGSGATVGSPIPAANVSANPLELQIPVAPTPLVTADPTNTGMASIRINPTADNTEYALVDGAGNIVYPFTTPDSADNGTITFNNLDPDTIYHVVTRATGSPDTIADRIAAGADLPVDTSNLGLGISEFKVDVFAINPATPLIQSVKIAGVAATEADLNSVKKGKTVEIVAPIGDAFGNSFYTWKIISPASGVTVVQGTNGSPTSPASNKIVFTMPNGPVKLQILYNNGTIWDPENWTGNNASDHNIGVTIPSINPPAGSRMRISIKKDSVPANIKQIVADTLSETYKPEYMFRIVVEQIDPTGNWVEYTDPSGDIHLDDVRINTGALDFTKNYMLHKLATSSNAASLEKENIGRVSSTTADPLYTGEFGQDMYAGLTYVFGYTKPVYYKVKVVDLKANTLVATLRIPETDVVEDYAASYNSYIQGDTVDNNGITWHYEGLSTDRDNYNAYDPTTRLTEDLTLYLFYSNDRNERRQAEADLKDAIQNAKTQLSKITDPAKRVALQTAIDAAQAVVDRTNRKSSTSELIAALDTLNAAIRASQGSTSGGGSSSGGGRGRGGSGGGSGSSGGYGKKSNTQNSGIRVGLDGNWELTNPAEAQANPDGSRWKFNLTNGGSVTGWAYLTYTYEGRTKSEWYHFGNDSIMDSGWFLDINSNTWYYLSMDHDGFFGEMIKGWHHDPDDTRWYFLDRNDGHMHVSWDKIDGNWYFFNPNPPAQTWFFDNSTGRWNYGDNKDIRPLGSMYVNEETPDGFHVNADGAWQ